MMTARPTDQLTSLDQLTGADEAILQGSYEGSHGGVASGRGADEGG